MDDVYVVFKEDKISCYEDFGHEGYLYIWDSEVIGVNMSTCKLLEKIKDIYSDIFFNCIREIRIKYALIFDNPGDKEKLDYEYLDQVYEIVEEEIGEGCFYRLPYQIVNRVRMIFSTEEGARKEVEYLNKKYTEEYKYHYTKYRVDE